MQKKYVMLSFDLEEFDIPREYGYNMTMEEQVLLSVKGVKKILQLLDEMNIKVTFFCTTNFACIAPEIIQHIINANHEIASHGCDHYCPKYEDIIKSKNILEEMFPINVYGYRQPRMQTSNINNVHVEYMYDASLNPTIIPGRYFNFRKPRTIFQDNDLIIIPSSTTPLFRIPLFWLSLHHFPLFFYKLLLKITLNRDCYFNTYFHPWEFVNLAKLQKIRLPYIIKHNTGDAMLLRLANIINFLKKEGVDFVTYRKMAMIYKNKL